MMHPHDEDTNAVTGTTPLCRRRQVEGWLENNVVELMKPERRETWT